MKLGRPPKDIVGQRFGYLTAVSRYSAGKPPKTYSVAVCSCVCGKIYEVRLSNLQRKRRYSCGCMTNVRHGFCRAAERGKKGVHRLYNVWVGMHQRCRNPNHRSWQDYGGRGIRVDASWKDPAQFIADMLPTWRIGLKLERLDNNGNYCATNCTWVSQKKQSRNTRRNVWIDTPHGKMIMADAIAKHGKVGLCSVQYRMKRGMNPWLAVTTPRRPSPTRKLS